MLPHIAGIIILLIGLITTLRNLPQKRGLDAAIAFGPLFFAVPLAVFGAEHFTATKSIAQGVPAWLPARPFLTLLVGACLIAAALSLAVRKFDGLRPGTCLAILLWLFVLLIHIPDVFRAPGNRIIWAVAFRGLAFAGGALALASIRTRPGVLTAARLLIAVAILFFAAEHFLHPEFAPGVPLARTTPVGIPARPLWGYLTGAVYLVAGLFLLIDRKARLAAAWLGLWIFFLVVIIYIPMLAADPSSIEGLNYLTDTLMLSGAVLALAGGETLVASRSQELRHA